MKRMKRKIALLLSLSVGLATCMPAAAQSASSTGVSDRKYIESTLNLANNKDQAWTYSSDANAWVMSIVSAVAYPELPDQQGVSVCVPGAYVKGIDTNGDGTVDVTAAKATETVKGALVIDYDAKVVSTNGQIYTASTAPVILNTGAAGYGSQNNALASTKYAADGYINVACGNRGKKDIATDANGKTYYTGDAPSCLVDQKSAARFVKYNILLGNLPGSVDYFVSTGGSGGGAHATMFATTSDHPDFYDYQIASGAVGVYKTADGEYSTSVVIGGKTHTISDGAWGAIAYSPITSLYEADMALAFEYNLSPDYTFNTAFQKQLAAYLSQAYMEYINKQELFADERALGFDINADGDKVDRIALKIGYDPAKYPETNGYYGTYLDLYLLEFTQNLQWYLDNLDYATDWTWFDANGKPLSDQAVAAMTSKDKAQAFLKGLYTKTSTGKGMGRPTGALPAGAGPTGNTPTGAASTGTGSSGTTSGTSMIVGTPDSGTTQSASSKVDSANYASYNEMVAAYKADVKEVYAGDKYGNNIVSLYNPLNYIRAKETKKPVWIKLLSGAAEGDISMFNSLNLQLALLNEKIDANIEWQWDGGHVPSEALGDSFSLYVDQMYAKHVTRSVPVKKATATKQTKNGTATAMSGTDISGFVRSSDIKNVKISLPDAISYRLKGASKAMPGFDVIDYGQEDYVFGNAEKDARHWNIYLVEIFEKYASVLGPLFNKSNS